MSLLAAMGAFVVGAVFVVAGASKVAAGARWPLEARALGVPTMGALAVVASIVPWWELIIGASLAAGLFRPWPAIAAVVTLAVFSVLLMRVLRRGEHPPCACFGAWSAAPLGWRHVARNAGLIGGAVLSVAVG